MKQYTGTKNVKAEPMTYGEAHKAGLIRENAYIEEYNDNEGYKVVYNDGYTSWSPKQVFEDAYKVSETALDRMLIEGRELTTRYEKACNFVGSDKFKELDTVSRSLLEAQISVMEDYMHIHNFRYTKMESGDGGASYLSFGVAISLLEKGYALRRYGWNGKGLMVFKQVPAHITEEIIPKMQSLPEEAKRLILASKGHIDYTSQCLIYNTNTGRADSWVPSISDVFADDWEVVTD